MAISIVVGIDGSRTSERALAMAIRIAAREGGQIHGCHVDHVASAAAFGGFFVPAAPVADDPEDRGHEVSRSVVEALGRAGVVGDCTCRRGEVATELERVAMAHEADLLVVGRSAHPHVHIGNVPGRLIAMGRRPVLVVP